MIQQLPHTGSIADVTIVGGPPLWITVTGYTAPAIVPTDVVATEVPIMLVEPTVAAVRLGEPSVAAVQLNEPADEHEWGTL